MSGSDNRCQMTDIQRSPGKFSYKVQCPDGSGTGEMTYQGKDSYTQVMTMTMDGETMKMSTQGKRIGSCDASKVKKQVAGRRRPRRPPAWRRPVRLGRRSRCCPPS